MTVTGKQLLTTLAADGTLTLEIAAKTFDAPAGSQVLIEVEAAPINPSDLGLLFASADTANAQYSPGKVIAKMPDNATRAMKARHGMAMPAGNECAGTVIAAGDDPQAQALIGKRIACVPGTAYATHALADARMAMPLADGVTAEQGASSAVIGLTKLDAPCSALTPSASGIAIRASASA